LQGLSSSVFHLPARSGVLADSDIAPFLIETGFSRLVLVDGRLDQSLSWQGSMPEGVVCTSLHSLVANGDRSLSELFGRVAVPIETSPFVALNAALLADGAVLRIPDGVAVDAPIHIVNMISAAASGAIVAPRTVIELGEGARAMVLETYAGAEGAAGYFTDSCTGITLGPGARLEHVRIQREGASAWHIGHTAVRQGAGSHYRSVALALGARLSRHDLDARLDAPEIETLLYGLYLGRDEQLVDNHTAIHHDHPRCRSWEVYKGVLAGRARAVFNGKVIVRPEAQQTDAKQTNRNLLLSDGARVNTKPQLEIFADDVKCTHGATVGRLDELQRFYLQTRGIGGRAAESLLIAAFVAEVLVEVREPRTREALEALVRAELDSLIG